MKWQRQQHGLDRTRRRRRWSKATGTAFPNHGLIQVTCLKLLAPRNTTFYFRTSFGSLYFITFTWVKKLNFTCLFNFFILYFCNKGVKICTSTWVKNICAFTTSGYKKCISTVLSLSEMLSDVTGSWEKYMSGLNTLNYRQEAATEHRKQTKHSQNVRANATIHINLANMQVFASSFTSKAKKQNTALAFAVVTLPVWGL